MRTWTLKALGTAFAAVALAACGAQDVAVTQAANPRAASSSPVVAPVVNQRAASMLLTTEDMPAGWRGSPNMDRASKCPGLLFSSLASQDKAHNYLVDDGSGDWVASIAVVLPSSAAAAAVQRHINSDAAQRCLKHVLSKAVRTRYPHPPDLGWRGAEPRRLSVPHLGDRSTGRRLAIGIYSKGGLFQTFTLDLLSIRRGSLLAYVTVVDSQGSGRDAALMGKISARMR